MNKRTRTSLAMLPIYAFINSCLPKKDMKFLDDAILNRLSLNYGTSDFAVSRMEKHYRKIGEKYLELIDDVLEDSEESLEEAGEQQDAEQDT